ncbi:2TM domain-containing protein [Flavobacterium sp.]|uniref:2TM domain-containing protein n=1 Tax=Flavobacterium sp. TaxID=239 RepID=UPI0037B32374
MEDNFKQNERYLLAKKRVKSIRGFYIHLFVYFIVNTFISVQIYMHNDGEFWRWENFSTALFWGIGLLAHGTSVFGSNLIFGKEWEERKIQEFMNKDKNQKWE